MFDDEVSVEKQWKEVVQNKFGQSRSWCNIVTSTYGVSVWRSRRGLWTKLSKNVTHKVEMIREIFFGWMNGMARRH